MKLVFVDIIGKEKISSKFSIYVTIVSNKY